MREAYEDKEGYSKKSQDGIEKAKEYSYESVAEKIKGVLS